MKALLSVAILLVSGVEIASAGTFQGRVFDLDGAPVAGEVVEYEVQQIDANLTAIKTLIKRTPAVEVTETVVLPSGKKTNRRINTFAFTIDPADLLPAARSKAIRITFFRRGDLTRNLDGLLADSDRTQIIDVTVPETPPCRSVGAGIRHRRCCAFARLGRFRR